MSNYKIPVSSNKELIEIAFRQIERETGLHIIDKCYDSTYFVFVDEKDSICEFHIKEIPGFRFAFWNTCRYDSIKDLINNDRLLWSDSLHIDTKSELIFFTQYERDLDKFKPSRSSFVTGIFRQEYLEKPEEFDEYDGEFNMYDLVDILNYMEKHPIKSYMYVQCGLDKVWQEVSGFKCLYTFILDSLYATKNRIKKKLKLKLLIYKCKQLIKSLETIDAILIDEGEFCSPRLEISYRRKNNIDINIYQKELDKLDIFEDKYFNSISLREFQVKLDKDSTEEAIEEDKQLSKLFKDRVNMLSDVEVYEYDPIKLYSNIQ